MKILDAINNSYGGKIDNERVSRIQEKYNCGISEAAKHIFSIPCDDTYYEERPILYILSTDMIVDAEAEMDCPFIEIGLIPVIDEGDNDYVCYNIASATWCVYNIVDQIAFFRVNNINELFA